MGYLTNMDFKWENNHYLNLNWISGCNSHVTHGPYTNFGKGLLRSSVRHIKYIK